MFPVTLSDTWPIFQSHDALDVLCAQLTRDLFAMAKFFVVINIYTMATENRYQKNSVPNSIPDAPETGTGFGADFWYVCHWH